MASPCVSATSPLIRRILSTYSRLPELLTTIDKLRGQEREFALQKALGVTAEDIKEQALGRKEMDEDVVAVRKLAEAVEMAVRGGKDEALGLDWGDWLGAGFIWYAGKTIEAMQAFIYTVSAKKTVQESPNG